MGRVVRLWSGTPAWTTHGEYGTPRSEQFRCELIECQGTNQMITVQSTAAKAAKAARQTETEGSGECKIRVLRVK